MSLINSELLEGLKNNEENAFEQLIQIAVQEALKLLPLAHENITKQAAVLHKMSKEFYEKHSDLVPHKQKVANTIEAVEAEYPGLGYQEILDKAALRVKDALKIEPTVHSSRKTLKEIDEAIGSL